MQQRGPELVLAAVRVLLDEAHVLERAQQSVDGPLGEPELAGQVDDAHPAGPPREQPQDGGGPLDRLNVPGHARLPGPVRHQTNYGPFFG